MARMLLQAPLLLLLQAPLLLLAAAADDPDAAAAASPSTLVQAAPPISSSPEAAAALAAPPPAVEAANKTQQDEEAYSPSASSPSSLPYSEKASASAASSPWSKCKGNYKGMSRELVNGHNAVRARYGAAPLRWDNRLALHARRWAKAMRKDCMALRHSTGKYGESIYLGWNGCNSTAKDALYMWSAEEPLYDKATGHCTPGHSFSDCGHFAIMVNKHYHHIGCGRTECAAANGVFITCNYYHTSPSSPSDLLPPSTSTSTSTSS